MMRSFGKGDTDCVDVRSSRRIGGIIAQVAATWRGFAKRSHLGRDGLPRKAVVRGPVRGGPGCAVRVLRNEPILQCKCNKTNRGLNARREQFGTEGCHARSQWHIYHGVGGKMLLRELLANSLGSRCERVARSARNVCGASERERPASDLQHACDEKCLPMETTCIRTSDRLRWPAAGHILPIVSGTGVPDLPLIEVGGPSDSADASGSGPGSGEVRVCEIVVSGKSVSDHAALNYPRTTDPDASTIRAGGFLPHLGAPRKGGRFKLGAPVLTIRAAVFTIEYYTAAWWDDVDSGRHSR